MLVISDSGKGGGRILFAAVFFRSQAMFRPRVFIVSMPSLSFSTSPIAFPWPMFQ